MIPAEAVEAAAKYLHDIDCRSAVHSGCEADFECYDWMDEAKKLVGIVAPYMFAQALDDAVDAFPLETIVAPDNAVVWMMRRAEELRSKL